MKTFIIEDSPYFFKIFQSILEPAGFEVLGYARDGIEGIKEVKARRPDLVILDMAIPGKNGLQVGRDLLSQFPHLKIIGVSGLDPSLVRDKAIEVGFVDFIEKPFSVDQFKSSLDKVKITEVSGVKNG